MQPATKEYEYCNEWGTSCGMSIIENSVENGIVVNSVASIDDSNEEQLLNLDHFYRRECSKILELNPNNGIPKDKTKKFSDCLVQKLTIAIKNRNSENSSYLEKAKKIFQ
jgi:hypothetical protein